MKVRMKKPTALSIMAVLSVLIFFVPPAEAVDVVIPDPALETAIRDALGIPSGPIMDTDLAGLTFFSAAGEGITDLTGLEYCVNLRELSLFNNNISDIRTLSGLANLQTLYLNNNNIHDIRPLSGLTNLRTLYLYNNNISDISPLSGLTNLWELSLNDNNISDISALSGLTNLRRLFLYSNNISDTQPLVDNTGLDSAALIGLRENPLSYKAINTDIPILQARGASVDFDDRTPTTLVTLFGNRQTGLTLSALPLPFVVLVVDQNGDPFAGVPVTFSVAAGGGSLDVENTTTDADGLAQVILTLGPSLGTNTVEVTAAEIAWPVTFEAFAAESRDIIAELTEDMIAAIKSWDLPRQTKSSLIDSLTAAVAALEQDNEQAAIKKLTSFIHLCETQRGKKLTAEQADYLIEGADRLIAAIKH